MRHGNIKRVILYLMIFSMVFGMMPSLGVANAQMSTLQKTDVNAVTASPGSYHVAALDDEGRVWTWANSSVYSNELGRAYGAASADNAPTKAAQVTTVGAADGGGTLPFILQISSSQRNTYALDRDGNIWSWGDDSYGALCRTVNAQNPASRPGRINMPNGVEAAWISGAFRGGKFVSTTGDIWVWGAGLDNALGTGNTNNITDKPVKLTTDSDGNPLPTNFLWVTSSDYFDAGCAMAITVDGRIYTWGGQAGIASEMNYLGGSRPKYVGTYKNVKKITCGNGTFGFLTEDGDVYTWGIDIVEGFGKLGTGSTSSRATPQKIEYVSIANNNTTLVPAPKFHDFSFYAWSSLAVDVNGVLYGGGANHNDKHFNLRSTNNYLARMIPDFTVNGEVPQIFVVEEGYTGSLYIDIYGNVYSRGNTTGGATASEPWVHFAGTNVPMFTKLDSTPTSEVKNYTSARTTLNVELNRAADEVRYIVLYQNDTDVCLVDDERFWDKSFAEFDLPYYNRDTSPQLLLSPNYNLWTSRYYANTQISEEAFEELYAKKPALEKGTMDSVSGSASRLFTKPNVINGNCIIWVQSKNAQGTTRMIYRFDNFYTQAKVWHEGVRKDNPDYNLYLPELVPGAYGVPLTREGGLIRLDPVTKQPPFGFDTVQPIPKNLMNGQSGLAYWILDPSGQTATSGEPDPVTGIVHRTDPTKEVVLNSPDLLGNESAQTPLVTFTYSKNQDAWADVTIKYVDENGEPMPVTVGGMTVTEQQLADFAPIGIAHSDGHDPFVPPDAVDDNNKVVGYTVDTKPGGAGTYTECSFPGGFAPVINASGQTIYIVYQAGMVEVTETYRAISFSDNTGSPILNNSGLLSVTHAVKKDEPCENTAPDINRYVAVGFEIDGVRTMFDWNAALGAYTKTPASISQVADDTSVVFLYKSDATGTGIPDEEQGFAKVNWIGVAASGGKTTLGSRTLVRNGYRGDTWSYFDAEGDKNENISANPERWIFHPSPTPAEPYMPAGSASPLTVTFEMGVTQEFHLYYDEDSNENGTADKDEVITTKYRLYGDFTTPLALDYTQQFLAGNSYHAKPTDISGYIAVGWVHGEYSNGMSDAEIHHITENGELFEAAFTTREDEVNTIITFIYRRAAQPLTVEWTGVTYGQNRVQLGCIVINGYVGEDITALIMPPVPIDTSMWSFRSTTLPSGDVLLGEAAQSYEFIFDERITFAVINVDGVSNDGKLSYSYKQEKRLIDPAFEVKAWPLPGYRVTGYEITDFYGNLMDSGAGDSVIADPSKGNQNIHFSYVSTVTSVVVKMTDEGANEIEEPIVFTDVRIGESFAVPAPHIDGYMLSDGQELLYVFDPIVEGTNAVTFRYEKIDIGEYALILRETDGGIIRVIGYAPASVVGAAPDLSDAYYSYDSANTAAFPLIMNSDNTLYYVKDMMDVVITAKNEDGETIGTWTDTARKGEMFQAVAGSVQGYSLAEAPTKSVYADPSSGMLNVVFNYKKDLHGSVTVSYYYLEGGERVTFYTYSGSAVVGSKITAEAMVQDGFELKPGEPSRKEITVAEGNNVIEFEYIDIRKTVTVNVRLGEGAAIEVYKTFKHPSGSTVPVPVPYIDGYVAVSCTIDGGTPVVIGSDFEGALVSVGDSNAEVLFEYKTLEQIISENYVKLTIGGSDGTSALFSYDIIVRKNTDTLVAAPSIPMYALDATKGENYSDGDAQTGTFGGYNVKLSANGSHTFYYNKNTAAVTIEFIDEASGLPIVGMSQQSVTGIIGEQITVNAPFISDYELVSGESASKTHTVTGVAATDKVSFTYKKSVGNVRFRYVSEGDGVVLAETRETVTLGTATAGLLPQGGLPTPPYGWELKGGTGVPQYSSATVLADTVITFTLSKVMRSITVNYLDYHSSAPVATAQTIQAQLGQTIDVIANPSNLAAGYVPNGAAYQCITVADTGNAVNFYYLYRAVSGAGAVTVMCIDEESGSVIFYKVHDAQAEGSPYSVTAPTLPGWIYVSRDVTFDAEAGTMLSTGMTVVYKYKKDIKRIDIFVGDRNGEPLIDINDTSLTLADTGYDEGPYLTIAVQSGMHAVINAPFFAGYTVMNQTPLTIDADDIDDAVTDGVYFKYARVTTDGAVLVRCVDGTQSSPNNVINSWMQWGNIDAPYSITVPLIPGYTPEGAATVTGVYGTDNVATFTYLPTVADVTIYALDVNDLPISGYVPVVLHGIRVGTPHTVVAPVISGYEVSGSYEATVTPTLEGPNSVTFRYKRLSGNILITAIDKDNPSHILAIWSEVRDSGESYTATPVQMAGWTAPSPVTITVQPGQNNVTLEYTKQLASVRIVALTLGGSIDNTGDILYDDTVTGVQVGTQYTAAMPYVQFHLLADGEPTSKSLYVSSNNGDNVIVFYMKASNAPVFIIHRDSDSGAILAVLTDNGDVGETYTATAMSISGYRPVGDTVKTGTIPDVADGDEPLELFFDYNRHMGTVTVELIDRGDGSLIDSYTVDVQYERATDIHAPLVSGYTLDDAAYRTVRLDTGSDATISFIYKSFDSIIAEGYVNIDVKGMAGAVQLYSYQMTVRKHSGTVTVNAFTVNGYRLSGAASVDVNVAISGGSVVFNYESLATTVTVHMRDEAGKPVADSFVLSAVTGEVFTANAPSVNGYYLTGSGIGTVGSVAADGSSEVVFTYKAIDSKVCIIAKELGSGRVIRMIPVEKPTVGTADYPSPDLTADFYDAVSPTVSITYDGINSQDVDVFYTKQLVDIPIEARDYSTGTLLSASANLLAGQRKGEAVTVNAPSVSGYTLTDSASRVVVATGGAVVFRYRTLAADEVLVKAVSEYGEVLQSYVLSGTVGETVYVRAPSILGWLVLGADTDSAVVGTNKEIMFTYGKNVVTVTVSLLDEKGSSLYVPMFNPSVEVAKGGNYTAYAPHVNGYVIDGVQSHTLTNVVTDTALTFRYKSIASVVDEYTVTITVRGIDRSGGRTLYSYSIMAPKEYGEYSAAALDVTGYTLGSDTPSPAIVTAEQNDVIVEFKYDSVETAVAIRAVIDGTSEAVPGYSVILAPAIIGEPFVYTAPYIPGYNLVGSLTQSIAAVGANEVMTFSYQKSSGNVTIILKEDDTNGRVIKTLSDTIAYGATKTVAVPDLTADYYTALSTAEAVTYSGSPLVVEYYYKKQTTLVQIELYDVTGGGETLLDTLDAGTFRLGDNARFTAPSLSGMKLTSDSPKLVTVEDGTVVRFDYSSLALTDLVVNAIDAASGDIIFTYTLTTLTGSSTTIPAPTFEGYVLQSGEPSSKVGTAPSIVEFMMVKDTVNVTVVLKDSSGNIITPPSGMQTVFEAARGSTVTVYAPHLPWYVLNGTQKEVFAAIMTDETVVFTYKTVDEAANERYAIITVTGLTGGTTHYSYSMRVAKSDVPMTLAYPAQIFAVNGYKLTDGQDFTFTPDGDKLISAEYEPNMTTVTIRAVYDDGGGYNVPIETFTTIVVPAEKGKSFYYNAPSITGFNNTGSSQNPVVPGDEPCEIVFYYKKANGNLTVIALDGSTEIGRFVRTIPQGAVDASDGNAPTANEIPALANYTLVANSGVPSEASYDGTNDVTLTYSYTRKVASLTLVAINTETGAVIADGAVAVSDLRILELYDYAADIVSSIDGYTLIPQGSTTVLIGESGNTVNIYYAPIKSMTVPVEVRVGSATGQLLYSYTVYAALGEVVTLGYNDAPTIDGYLLNSGLSVLTATEGAGDRIIFVMDDMRATIRVSVSRSGGAPELYSTVKTVIGGTAHIYPPYLNGYVLDSASADGVTLAPVTGDTDILFEYVRIEDVIDRFVVNIVIRGVDDKTGRQLYSYVVTKARNSGTFTASALDMTGYQFTGTATIELPTDGTAAQHEFYYTSLAAAVTVYAELSTGGAVPGFTPIVTAAVYGQPFSYNAPYIPGYVLDDSITKTLPSVAPDANTVTFIYVPATGNVTIILREDDENGVVIKTMQDDIANGESKAIAIPDLSGDHYTAISTAPATVTFSGEPQTVNYYYAKNLRTVEVVCYDVTTGSAVLSRTVAGDRRIGETASFSAPLINGYKPVSTTPQYVIVTDGEGNMEVRFDYVTLANSELLVAAVDSDSGNLLHSYVLTGRVGEEMTVTAPNLLGWALDSASTMQKTIPDTAVFYYSADTVTINLALTDTNGNDLTDLATVPVSHTAPRSGDFVAYAPHLPGYTLVSGQSYSFANVTSDKTAEFIYKKTISDEVADITISYYDFANGRLIKSEVATGQTVGQTFVYSAPSAFNYGGTKYERHSSTPALVSVEVAAGYEIKLYYTNKGPETIEIPGSGGGPSYETATLTVVCIDLDSGERLYSLSVSAVVGSTETVNAPSIKGYKLADGNPDKQSVKIATSGNTVVFNYIADEEEKPVEHHIKYINGYPDGSVHPDGDITRAEAAAIFFRILEDDAKNTPVGGQFSDVHENEWYAQSVNYLASLGILSGYPDGTFKPSQTMTRAEFASVAARFGGMVEYSGTVFADVQPTHWAAKYIGSAYALGWINGYPDGTFKPSQNITRAEVVRIINGILNRCIEAHDIPQHIGGYTDLTTAHWAYTEIIEASYGHYSTRKENGCELWSKIDD